MFVVVGHHEARHGGREAGEKVDLRHLVAGDGNPVESVEQDRENQATDGAQDAAEDADFEFFPVDVEQAHAEREHHEGNRGVGEELESLQQDGMDGNVQQRNRKAADNRPDNRRIEWF